MRVALLAALLTAALAGRAHAFVRLMSTGSQPKPTFWKESCVPVTVYLNGFDQSPNALSVPDIAKSVAAAAHAWSSVECPGGGSPSLEIVPTLAQAGPPAPADYDARNSIIFRTDFWGRSGNLNVPYRASALANTGPTAAPDGHLLDADIEIDASPESQVWLRWINLDPGVLLPPVSKGEDLSIYDLQTTLTHELGHFLGLDHTCLKSPPASGATHPTDDRGQQVPDCGSVTSEGRAAVMYPDQDTAPTTKRTLTPDDIRGVCAIYPPSRASVPCALDQAPASGCAVAAPTRPGVSALAGLATLVALARRRRALSARARARA